MEPLKCPECQKHTPANRENCVHCGYRILAMQCPECEVVRSKSIIEHRQAIDEINRRLINIRISEYDSKVLAGERDRFKQQLQFLAAARPGFYPENIRKCPVCGTPLKKRH